LIGHTDEAGTEPYNLKLSQDRASSVRDYVIRQYAVDGARMRIDGRGKQSPLYRGETHNSSKARLNRRVELVEQ
jgi:OmpA-OmpF porin, OOP family